MLFVKILIKTSFSILNLHDYKTFKNKDFKMFIMQITKFGFY